MRVAVVGAGGIGGLYGAVLARAGHDVAFLARGAHLEAIRRNGLQIRSSEFGAFSVHPPASVDPGELGHAELVLFAVKTYDLEPAAEAVRPLLDADGSVLTFQNGLDAPDRLAAVVGDQHVLIGTTTLETTILEPGVVAHLSPFHFVTVSAFEGPPTDKVSDTVAMLRQAGINASVVDDGHRALWEKALFLSPMAAITAACQSPIGPIRELPESAELFESLLAEVSAVARASGYDLPEATQAALDRMRSVPPTVKASMARDFERGRRTELEALVGALVRMADARRVSAPAMRTVYALLKLREQTKALGLSAGGG